MSTWTETLASALGVPPLSEEEAERLLDASRDVAHRVERKDTPLTTFLVGTAVGRATAGGLEPAAALDDALGHPGPDAAGRGPGRPMQALGPRTRVRWRSTMSTLPAELPATARLPQRGR